MTTETETTEKPIEVAELVIRRLIGEMQNEPIAASFIRGVGRNWSGHYVKEDIVQTMPGTDRRVLLIPGATSVAISAQRWDYGWDIVGGGIADTVEYPTAPDGGVDTVALGGPGFRADLRAAIVEKLNEATR